MRVTWRGWHLVGIRPPSGKAPMLDAYLIPSVLHRHAEEEAEAAKLALKQEHERSMSRAREVEALRSELLGKEAELEGANKAYASARRALEVLFSCHCHEMLRCDCGECGMRRG